MIKNCIKFDFFKIDLMHLIIAYEKLLHSSPSALSCGERGVGASAYIILDHRFERSTIGELHYRQDE